MLTSSVEEVNACRKSLRDLTALLCDLDQFGEDLGSSVQSLSLKWQSTLHRKPLDR